MVQGTNFSSPGVYLLQDAEERALVGRCLGGEVSAFEPLVERYQRPFFTIAVRLLGNHDEAKDVVQNTFVKAFEKLSTFDPKRRFFSWAYRILLNECHNARRARRQVEMLPVELAAEGGPIDIVESKERRQRVQAAILALPYEHRQVIVLRHFTGLSYEEVAEILGLPVKTVRSRLHTAKQRLATMLLQWERRK